MKLNEPCYAAVRENGEVDQTSYGSLFVFASRNHAEPMVEYERRQSGIVPVTLLPTSEVERLRKCEAVLMKAGHIIDQIAVKTNSVPKFLDILNEIVAALTPSGDGETEK